MRTASVSELKMHLSRYLREVRRGGEVQILRRGVPVARLVRPERGRGPGHEHRDRLIRSGILRPGTGDATHVLDTPPFAGAARLGVGLEEDREDRL
jgi:antitoxin (DNA-binding transcriptional repressor) of toxin-antitoxin stability system